MANIDTEAIVPYKASEMNDNIEKEIERLGGQALWGWDKESRNLLWFGLIDGMSILELGSGPGFVTEQLIALCPNSHITCVEIDRRPYPASGAIPAKQGARKSLYHHTRRPHDDGFAR